MTGVKYRTIVADPPWQRLGWDTWGNEALEHVELGGDR